MQRIPVWLIGFMGSGKSTHGARLARSLGYTFIDMDQHITSRVGLDIPGIFARYGEQAFRDMEKKAVEELSTVDGVVVATGGGAPCHNDLIGLMKQSGLTVYLQLPPEALAQRLAISKGKRPLIEGKSGEELDLYVRETLNRRSPYYLQAHVVLDAVSLQSSALSLIVRKQLEAIKGFSPGSAE